MSSFHVPRCLESEIIFNEIADKIKTKKGWRKFQIVLNDAIEKVTIFSKPLKYKIKLYNSANCD